MVQEGRRWNVELITRLFNQQDVAAILQIPLSMLGVKDKLIWMYSNNGLYSVSSAYSLLARQKSQPAIQPESSCHRAQEQQMWKRIWALPIKGKVKHFLWRACHKFLPTGSQLQQQGLDVDGLCQGCGEEPETMEHLFFHCPKVQTIWRLSPVNWAGLQDFSQDFPTWWKTVCSVGKKEIDHCRVELTAYLLWGIWKMRNKWCFEKETITEMEVVERSRIEWLEFSSLHKEEKEARQKPNCLGDARGVAPQGELMVGYHTIYTSSIFQKWPLKSGFGLLAIDGNRNQQPAKVWLRQGGLDAGSLALEVVRSAQLLAHQRGWTKIIIRNDIHEIVNGLQQPQGKRIKPSPVLDDIILLRNLFDDCIFSYITRQENIPCVELIKSVLSSSSPGNGGSNHPAWL